MGDVVAAAGPGGADVVEAVGIAGGRIVTSGTRTEVRDAAAPGARVIDARGHAVVPGLHDAHLHLVDLARSRRSLDLVPARDFGELVGRVRERDATLAPGAWLRGRGWSSDSLTNADAAELGRVIGDRPAFLGSRDGHSAWASPVVLERAGVTADRADPPGGRIERTPGGEPNGIVRETAVELVRPFVERLGGIELRRALEETVGSLTQLGLTGVTDAGDFTAESGVGEYSELGDSFSALAEHRQAFADRLRVNANVPAAGLAAAVEAGLRTGQPLGQPPTVRVGWVKVFSDGALGSRTAALFEPYSCESGANATGLMTVTPDELDDVIREARAAGVGVAIHAIGDRANATVLDAYERAGHRSDGVHDRIEHAQLTRPPDRSRMASLGIVASMQPIHCPADAPHIDRCWAGRERDSYAWRAISAAGVTLAFGSDAPVEPVNPWLGIHAAVNRREPGTTQSWQPQERLGPWEALAAYTVGPAAAGGHGDEGILRPGARADLAVLSCGMEALEAADDRLPDVRAELTLVGGVEVRR